MVTWFYKDYIKSPHTKQIPPIIGNISVNLIDLLKAIKDMGGADKLLVHNKWNEVAMKLGYITYFSNKFEECYVNTLQLLDLYYQSAKKTQSQLEKETVYWNGNHIELDPSSFTSFIMIMQMSKDNIDAKKNRKLLIKKFNETVKMVSQVICIMILMPPSHR